MNSQPTKLKWATHWASVCELLILVLAVAMRLVLALINDRANDYHLEVSAFFERAVKTGSFNPAFFTCWECYHPKLYHYLCALLITVLDISNELHRVITGQVISAVAGIVTVIVVNDFLKRTGCADKIRLLALALVALNPKLVAINVQATNDSLAILFGVLVSYWFWLFVKSPRATPLIFSAGFLFLGLLTKGNALVFAVVMLLVLSVLTVSALINRRRFLPYALGILGISAALALLMVIPRSMANYGGYFRRLWETESLAAVNFNRAPRPDWFTRTYVGRPGVTSIYDSYATFRLIDLLQTPYITSDSEPFPLNRTSLWSQLYGRYHFSYFDQWPWTRRDSFTINLGRTILTVALIPSLLFLVGIAAQLWRLMRDLARKRLSMLVDYDDWVFPVTTMGFIGLVVVFTLEHRGFESMKAIYLMPSFLAMIAAYLAGWRVVTPLLTAHSIFRVVVFVAQWALVLLYVANSVLLIEQLM